MSDKSEFKQNIDRAIAEGRHIKMRIYAMLNRTESELQYIIESILEKYGYEQYLSAVYSAVKELGMNGARANIKRILFKEKAVDVNDAEQLSAGLKFMKSRLTESWVADYARKAKVHQLYVDIIFDYNQDRLILKVLNNSPLSRVEDERIREKFEKGSKYDNIAEFYMENMDNTEGAGMGITMILMMLKGEGIDPHVFTINSDYKTHTEAKIEFPFHNDHVTEREKFEQS